MKFVDLAKIFIKAGRGGNGAMSFRREKFIPKGGPDGADGGKGGDVIIEAVGGIVTLADFEYNKRFQAGNGGHGSGALKTGANGEDLKIFVPCGTLLLDEDNNILADLTEPGQNFIAAHGGRGGRGNAHFANSQRRAPKFAEKGDSGEDAATSQDSGENAAAVQDAESAFVLPRKMQSLIYAKAVQQELGLQVVGALYFNPLKGIVRGAYDRNIIGPESFPNYKQADIAANEVPGPGTPSFQELIETSEALVESRIEELLDGNIIPNPISDKVCMYCPVGICEKRLEKRKV